MAEGDVVDIVEDEIEAGWAWVRGEAAKLYDAVSPLVSAALRGFETAVVDRLWGAMAALVAKLPKITSLADLETALLNVASGLGGGLLEAAKAAGSNLLQSVLGLLQAHAAS